MAQRYSLAVNTCQAKAQILLVKNNTPVAEKIWEKSGSHSEVLTAMAHDLLHENGCTVHDLEKVFCVVGPGSFTGIRVGVSFARTLAWSLDIPCVSVSLLDLLALQSDGNHSPLLSTIDAQKNSLFVSTYSIVNGQWTRQLQNQLISLSTLEKFTTSNFFVCGNGISHYQQWIDSNVLEKFTFLENSHFADLKRLFDRNFLYLDLTSIEWFQLQPLYIKASAPEEKLHPTEIAEPD